MPQPRLHLEQVIWQQKTNHKIIGVIENMSYLTLADGQVLKVFGQGGGEKVAADLETQLLIQMPIEQPEPNANGYISAILTLQVYQEKHIKP